jgi:hypothetical protein
MGLGCIPTTLQLTGIQRIDVWYSDNGCFGLKVTFSNGRWDPNSLDFDKKRVFDSKGDGYPFESMKIWMSDYFYKNRVGNDPITLVRSTYYIVVGIYVGKRSVGDLKSGKCVVAVDVSGFSSLKFVSFWSIELI